MRCKNVLLILSFFFLLPSLALAADRFWVGGTGSWDGTTTHWAASSGGSGGASSPTASDNVYFDSSSSTLNAAYTVTISASATCLDFTMAGPGAGNKVTWAGASALAVSGSMNLSGGTAGITRTYSGSITFNATSGTKTLTFNGVAFGGSFEFNGVGGVWQLADTFNTGGQITLTNGTFDTNGKTVTANAISSSNSNVRTLILGSSTVTLTGASTAINLTTSTNLTFNCGTSTILIQNGGPMQGGGNTFYNVQYGTSFLATPIIYGANTFTNFTVTNAAVKTVVLSLGADQTITGTLTLTGNSAVNRLLINSDTLGTRRTLTAENVSITHVDFQDIGGAGAAAPFSGTSLGDALGNGGITFTQNPGTANGYGGVYRYWVKGGAANSSGSWSDTTHWATSSGAGVGGATVPLPQDTVLVDAGSIDAVGRTITVDMPRIARDIDFTGVTHTPAWSFSNGVMQFGSLNLTGLGTLTNNQSHDFYNRSPATLTTGGVAATAIFKVYGLGTTLTLQDVFSGWAFWLYAGTLDFNNKDVTLSLASNPGFYTTGSIVRTLNMGSGTCAFTATTTWNVSGVANFTLNPGTSTIKLANTSSNALTFTGAGLRYNNIWFDRGTSTGSNTISGSNTFNEFKDTGTEAHSLLFTAGTTTTLSTWNVSGASAAKKITINSTSTATHALVKTGGGIVSANYLNIQHSVATPAITTWYAGTEPDSTNNQGVATTGSGWIFAAAPSVCTATATGNGTWGDNTDSHWSGCTGAGGIPAAADNVVINSGVTITLDVNTPSVNSLAINGTLDTSGSNYQVNARNLSVNDGGTFNANASTITLSGTDGVLFTTGSSATFNAGTSTVVMNPDAAVTLTSGTAAFRNLTLSPTLSAARTYTFGAGAVTVSGDLNSDPSGGGSARTLTVNLGAGGLTVAGGFTLGGNSSGTTTLNTVSSVNAPLTFATVTINSGSTLTPNGSNVNITGTSGTLIANTGTWTAQTATGTTTLSGNGSVTVSSAPLTFYNLTLSGAGAVVLGADTTVGYILTLNSGTLDIGSGRTHTFGVFSSNNSNVRTLTLNDSTINLINSGTTVWNIATALNLTLNQGTSTIKITDTTVNTDTFAGGGKVYNNLWLARGVSAGATVISGSNTFADVKYTGTAAHSLLFTAGSVTTVLTFTVNGSAGKLITINSNGSTSTHSLVKSGGGTISCDYLNIQHSVATPANTWYAGSNSINNQAVATAGSGWNFITPFNPLFLSGD